MPNVCDGQHCTLKHSISSDLHCTTKVSHRVEQSVVHSNMRRANPTESESANTLWANNSWFSRSLSDLCIDQCWKDYLETITQAITSTTSVAHLGSVKCAFSGWSCLTSPGERIKTPYPAFVFNWIYFTIFYYFKSCVTNFFILYLLQQYK